MTTRTTEALQADVTLLNNSGIVNDTCRATTLSTEDMIQNAIVSRIWNRVPNFLRSRSEMVAFHLDSREIA
jgi:hypothetical protein